MKQNKFSILLALLLLGVIYHTTAQERLSREEYIERYKGIAIEHMDIYGIPASIKMAQALHESDNGNSRLARQANNHFGIKCKSTWTGETISHDDDDIGECFRKYAATEESFLDHSEFLDKSARYQDLFKLEPTDYKGWAHGLKQAGYATNPKYAEILIKIIEDNQLYALDNFEGDPTTAHPPETVVEIDPIQPQTEPVRNERPQPSGEIIDIDNYSVAVSGRGGKHTVYHNNGSEFVVTQYGDTYAGIAAEFGISMTKLLKFNDLSSSGNLEPGTMLYIKQKNKRSENGKILHITKEGETMHSISQMYGIRLKNLYNFNRRPQDSEIREGQQIRLM